MADIDVLAFAGPGPGLELDMMLTLLGTSNGGLGKH